MDSSSVEGHIEQLKMLFSGEMKYRLTLLGLEEAELVIEEADKYKTYRMGKFGFKMARDEGVRESVMFRYQRMKERENMLD